MARCTVMVCGVLAYTLALHADRVYDLVKEASAFGSAGVFTVVLFGLFTRFGGVYSAFSSLLIGIIAWISSNHIFSIAAPYLFSLAAAMVVYTRHSAREITIFSLIVTY